MASHDKHRSKVAALVMSVFGLLWVLGAGARPISAHHDPLYDCAVEIVEVTQAVQRYGNVQGAVPLVAGRATAVRMHVTAIGPDCTGTIYAYLRSNQLGLEIGANNNPVAVSHIPAAQARQQENGLAFFTFLPGAISTASAQVTFQGMVSRVPPQALDIHPPFDECLQSELNCASKTVTFTSKPRPMFIGIPVDYTYSGAPLGMPNEGFIAAGVVDSQLQAVWPLPDVGPGGYVLRKDLSFKWKYCVQDFSFGDGNCTPDPRPPRYNVTEPRYEPFFARLVELNCNRQGSNQPPKAAYIMGWLPGGARPGGRASEGQRVAMADTGINLTQSRMFLAHEMGHIMLKENEHRNSTIQEIGWDVLARVPGFAQRHVRALDTTEIMAEGGFGGELRWVPPDNYLEAFNSTNTYQPTVCQRTFSALNPPPVVSFNAVQATLYAGSTGAAYLRPTIEIENRVDLSPVALGNGQMVVKDGAGATLYDTHFAVDAAVDTRVLVPVPVLASAARIQLLKNGLLQDELLRSATAPTVDLLSPTSGEALGASVTVQWDMQDPDPDTELFATVLYSPDGVRWEPMAVRTDESSLVADTTRMASTTDGIIQVRVSDGFTTTIAQVEHLKLMPNRLPDVAISAPTDGSTVSQYSNVVFSGTAYDPEDEFIGPTHLEWYSDLDGFIGTGESLNAEGPAGFGPYSIGLHRIELRAYDSTGQSASAYVYLTVQ